MLKQSNNKHTLHMGSPVKGAKHIGSISLESGQQLQDLDMNESPTVSRAPMTDQSGKQRGIAGSMVTRIRNQSEIADTRN